MCILSLPQEVFAELHDLPRCVGQRLVFAAQEFLRNLQDLLGVLGVLGPESVFVEAEGPIERFNKILANRRLVCFEGREDVLELLLLDHQQVIPLNALDHGKVNESQNVLGRLLNDGLY